VLVRARIGPSPDQAMVHVAAHEDRGRGPRLATAGLTGDRDGGIKVAGQVGCQVAGVGRGAIDEA
jgi:hypothetical protein